MVATTYSIHILLTFFCYKSNYSMQIASHTVLKWVSETRSYCGIKSNENENEFSTVRLFIFFFSLVELGFAGY